jgi:ankyrin repeat protein
LIAAGANINAENSWKITPVNLAMMKNRRTCVKKLLEHGAIKVNCTDENGRSLLQLVMIHVDERT